MTIALALFLFACKNGEIQYDASGVFEADEIIVSSEIAGRILEMPAREGQHIAQDSLIAQIDAGNLELQQQQVEASIQSLQERTAPVGPQLQLIRDQLSVQQTQLNNLLKEQKRFQALVEADAATPKQLDDINAQIATVQAQMAVTRQQLQVQQTSTSTQNRAVLSERTPLQKRSAIIADQVSRGRIISPINGTVLTTYANAGEMTAPGKPILKMADLSTIVLRAYITNAQLAQLKLGQPVQVIVSAGEGQVKKYTGNVSWIAEQAEFTPKTIQTVDERANLVYATKITVPNDGYLKIGMYGEVVFNTPANESATNTGKNP